MTIALAAHVSATDTDSGMVLLDERSGRYWQLNGTGAEVVRRLADGKGPHEVITMLRERHPPDAHRIEGDVHELLRSLRDARLVES